MDVFCDTEQLVVLRHAVRPCGCAGLDLTCPRPHSKISDGDVFGFAASVRNDVVHAVGGCQIHGLEGFSHRSNLIDLHEHGVGRSEFDALSQPFGLGDKQVIAHGLHAVAVSFRER